MPLFYEGKVIVVLDHKHGIKGVFGLQSWVCCEEGCDGICFGVLYGIGRIGWIGWEEGGKEEREICKVPQP